jgi:hypothetical protein
MEVSHMARLTRTIFFAAFLITLVGPSGLGTFDAHANSAPSRPSIISTGQDQTGLAVTIYNSNIGLVKDLRRIELPKGTAEVRFMDVASQIISTSVHIGSAVDPRGFTVLEQNYEYDLLKPASQRAFLTSTSARR